MLPINVGETKGSISISHQSQFSDQTRLSSPGVKERRKEPVKETQRWQAICIGDFGQFDLDEK